MTISFWKIRFSRYSPPMLLFMLVFASLLMGDVTRGAANTPQEGELGPTPTPSQTPEFRRLEKLPVGSPSPTPSAGDQFGYSVAISRDTAVVGAPETDSGRGKVYVYVRSGVHWVFQAALTAPGGGAAGDKFGFSVDIDGDVVIVGVPFAEVTDGQGTLSDFGSAYIFRRTYSGQSATWTNTEKIENVRDCLTGTPTSCTNWDNTPQERFGYSVAIKSIIVGGIENTKVAIGAFWDHYTNASGALLGTVSVVKFDPGTSEDPCDDATEGCWQLYGTKIPGPQAVPSGSTFPAFGQSVDLSLDSVVIGAPTASLVSGPATGAVFIYPLTTQGWNSTTFTGSTASFLGNSVAIDGNTVAMGAPGASPLGKAYTSTYSGLSWGSLVELVPLSTDRDSNGGIGQDVAVHNDMIIVGSQTSSLHSRAYVFRRRGENWVYKRFLDQTDNTSGDNFGVSVGIYGNQVIVGANTELSFRGTASIFRYLPRTCDFDDNEKSNFTVVRPDTPYGWYWYMPPEDWGFESFGSPNGSDPDDLIAPADFDGDGITDVAVFRPSEGKWYIQASQKGFLAVAFGSAGDLPRPNDFDGDGKADLAVFRPSNSTWYWVRSSDDVFAALSFGAAGDIPLMADRDGDGVGDPTVFKPSTGEWSFKNIRTGATETVTWGQSTDKLAIGDFDGDLKSDLSIFRPSDGTWYINGTLVGYFAVAWGANGDIPSVLDYDGDGKSDISVFRPSNGDWYLINSSTSAYTLLHFGANGDLSAPAAYQSN